MYPRVKSHKNKDGTKRSYLFICESVRDGKNVRQETIANLGRVDTLSERKRIKEFALSLIEYCEDLHVLDSQSDLDCENGKEYGTLVAFRKIWEILKLDKILADYLKGTKLEFNAAEVIFSMVVNRLSQPESKLGMYNRWLDTVHAEEWQKFELQYFYRALDFLYKYRTEIKHDLQKRIKKTFGIGVEVVMFDCTTILSYGEEKSEQDLLGHGHSKVQRMDLPQILVGLIMSKEGVPLGYEVWKGNKSEKVAFKEIFNQIKKDYQINRVVLVCDRGMMSGKNIDELEGLGFEYVLGVRMRQLSETRKRLMLEDSEGYRVIKDPIRVKEITELDIRKIEHAEKVAKLEAMKKDALIYILTFYSCILEGIFYAWPIAEVIRQFNILQTEIPAFQVSEKELEAVAKRKFIVCYNPETAKEDQEIRERFKEIIKNKLDYETNKYWIVRNGYKKYIKINSLEMKIDYAKIEQESMYDGKWVLITNTNFTSQEVAFSYKGLWQIERLFRTLKSELEAGPFYHWTEKRIQANMFACFLALLLRTYLEKQLKKIDENISYLDVIHDLKQVQAVPVEIKGKQTILRSKLKGKASLVFDALKMKVPSKVLSKV